MKSTYTTAIFFEDESTMTTYSKNVVLFQVADAVVHSLDARLSDARLSDARLSDARLSDARLSDARLSDAPLSDAPLSDAPLLNVRLPNVRLPNVRLPNVRLPNVLLPNVRLPNVRFPNARVKKQIFLDENASLVHMERIRLLVSSFKLHMISTNNCSMFKNVRKNKIAYVSIIKL